jgi:hypothetical protein
MPLIEQGDNLVEQLPKGLDGHGDRADGDANAD